MNKSILKIYSILLILLVFIISSKAVSIDTNTLINTTSGSDIIYSTYLGGSLDETGYDIAVD